MEDARPAQRVYVTLSGRDYELVGTDKLTMPELKEAKRICEMPLADMEVAFAKADPDAWVAMLYVSIRRVIPSTTLRDVYDLIGDTPLVAVVETLRNDTPESAQEDPQTLPSVGGTPKNETGSGAQIPPPLTLEISGHPS